MDPMPLLMRCIRSGAKINLFRLSERNNKPCKIQCVISHLVIHIYAFGPIATKCVYS